MSYSCAPHMIIASGSMSIWHSVSISVFYVEALVGTFSQEKGLVGAFSVITNLRIAFVSSCSSDTGRESLELGAAALFVANHHRRIANLTRLTDCLARVGPGDEFLQTVHT